MIPKGNSNFDPPMIFRRINKIYVTTILLTLALGWIIWVKYADKESRLREEQSQFLAGQRTVWLQQDADRALTTNQKVLERKRTYAEEVVKALGGPVAAVTKNPALDIRQMLDQIARACAPAGTEVSVTVDRFTEFEVTMVLSGPSTFTRLAEISKCFLTNCIPYVHSLQFIQGNEVLAGLNGVAIESVTNWNDVSVESVQELLLAAGTQSQPAAVSLTKNDGNTALTDGEDLAPDQIKLSEAQNTFKKHFADHVRVLNELVTNLSQAAQLDSFKSRDQLQSRINSLDQLGLRLAAEREFFMNQSADLERLLNDQGFDPLLISIIKRDFNKQNKAEEPILTNLFDAISGYQSQIRAFLTSMESHWGEWVVENNTHQFQPTTSAANDAYVLGEESVRQRAESVQDAFQSWANYKSLK